MLLGVLFERRFESLDLQRQLFAAGFITPIRPLASIIVAKTGSKACCLSTAPTCILVVPLYSISGALSGNMHPAPECQVPAGPLGHVVTVLHHG